MAPPYEWDIEIDEQGGLLGLRFSVRHGETVFAVLDEQPFLRQPHEHGGPNFEDEARELLSRPNTRHRFTFDSITYDESPPEADGKILLGWDSFGTEVYGADNVAEAVADGRVAVPADLHGEPIYDAGGFLVVAADGRVGFEIPAECLGSLAQSLLEDFRPAQLRILRVLSLISPESWAKLSQRLDEFVGDLPPIRTAGVVSPASLKPTRKKLILKYDEIAELLRSDNARISYQQVYLSFYWKEQTAKKYLAAAQMAPPGRWRGRTFTSKELRERFVPWLRQNLRDDQRVVDFINVLIAAGIVREGA
ncbi:MAG: hypothetical protein KA383_12920 [Phycisphaerae bacterium]|nr:hypothetical protein [Phycisphaerae bacterium]